MKEIQITLTLPKVKRVEKGERQKEVSPAVATKEAQQVAKSLLLAHWFNILVLIKYQSFEKKYLSEVGNP